MIYEETRCFYDANLLYCSGDLTATICAVKIDFYNVVNNKIRDCDSQVLFC